MKSYISIWIISALFLLGWNACTSDKTSGQAQREETATDSTGPEYTSAWVCPMHCEGSGSAEPGKCPVCNMDYIENKNATPAVPDAESETEADTNADGSTEVMDDAHEGHNHAH